MIHARLKTIRWGVLLLILAMPAGAVDLQPYGFLLATYEQYWGRPNNIEVPTQASSAGNLAASNQNVSDFTVRQSRLGLNLLGGKGPMDSDLSGVVEIDFAGLRNSGTSSADVLASAPRLRLAYIQAKRGDNSVVFGQDWIKAFAPLNPTSLMHVAIPALSNSGNLWNRIPQLRWDRTWGIASSWKANTKLAVVRSFTGDETGRTTTVGGTTFAVPTSVDGAGSGEFSGGPAYQALTEIQKDVNGRSFIGGVSGQYIKETFNVAVPPPAGALNRQTSGWLGSAHFIFPILKCLELSGEGYYGHGNQNLNGLGAVYNDLGTIRLSQVRGGWGQITVKPIKDWRVNAMTGFEDVNQTGLAAATIYRNESEAVNVMWDTSPEFTLALEWGRIHSYYVAALSGDSENLGLSAQYKFGK